MAIDNLKMSINKMNNCRTVGDCDKDNITDLPGVRCVSCDTINGSDIEYHGASNFDKIVEELSKKISDLTKNVSLLTEDLKKSQSDISTMMAAQKTIQTDITAIKSEQTTMKADIEELKKKK